MKIRLAACSAIGGMLGGTLAVGLPEFYKKRERLSIKVIPPSFYMGGINMLPVYTTCLGILPSFLRCCSSFLYPHTNTLFSERDSSFQ